MNWMSIILLSIEISGIKALAMLYGMSLFLVILSFIFFWIVMSTRKSKEKLRNQKEILVDRCREFISELVFEDDLCKESKQFEHYLLSSNFRSQILLEELINLHKSLKGELAHFLEGYFINKKLYKLSFSKVKSHNDYDVIEGLYELSKLNAKVAIPMVLKIYRRQQESEMKNYFLEFLINQSPKEGIDELIKASTFLSDWFQIKVINILNDNNFIAVPPLSKWLKRGGSHAIFGCKLTAYAKVHSEADELIGLLDSKNDDLKIEALRALVALEAKQNDELLIKNYFNQSDLVQREILLTLTQFESDLNVVFLNKCKVSKASEIRLFARNALNKLSRSKKYLELQQQASLAYSRSNSGLKIGA
ncbi:HEAT repeat domain-containing protein [Arcticibacterium luteifluviistationis]|uniref:HEAT repeat domain-containing protein n=1 Tax=Arcticibacterium luteifluviistationis TaxID=1784714 RepID=A0A2Z4G6R2_9BACT|nr:hypothetical protein [Arcticibacterium luteifluviistationis]AWV96839.1 hypothetical protein DJ013_01025 [Arcticibacterium luteifluviistationis]